MKRFTILLIRFYQKFLSFDTGVLHFLGSGAPACRFTPRCSEYTINAISSFGVFNGLIIGWKRISRCHRGNEGGFDPVRVR